MKTFGKTVVVTHHVPPTEAQLSANHNFKLSDEAEVSSAEEQLTRNNLNDGNDKAVEKNLLPLLFQNHALKNLLLSDQVLTITI